LAPVVDIIKKNFGIKKAIMTTIHSYTAGQNLIDGPNKDLRRGRAAALNIVPTSTGAAIATTKTIPSLKNKFDGMAVRVPTAVGSLCDVVFITNKKIDEKKVNDVFKRAAKSAKYKNLIIASEEEIVSSDIVGSSHSAIVDLPSTKVVDKDMLKIVAWYDNEWGYSSRLVDLCEILIKKNNLS
jgi:glyceraldehyde 3-phosphate dehydrogenase